MADLKTFTRNSMRKLLRVDQPVEQRTTAEVEAERDQNFRWNYAVNSVDVILFMSGISLLSATTILPLFVTKLTDATWPLAIVAMVAQSGFFLPQLFMANTIERLNRKKPVIVNLGLITERLPAMLIVISPIVALWSKGMALLLFLLFFTCFNLGGGVVATAWQDLIARCFPVNWRGRFFGGNMFLGTALGVGVAAAAGVVLDRYAFPYNFIVIFGVSGVMICISWLFLAMTREPVEVTHVPRVSTRAYMAAIPNVIRSDANFRSFLLARTMMAFAEMGTGFLTIAAIDRWEVADSFVATLTTATLIGQTSASLLVGVLADRKGHRVALELSGVALIAAFAMAWLAPSPIWFVGVFFLLGFFMGARIVSGTLVVMEFCAAEKRPTYIGLTNTLVGIASALAPLVGLGLVKLGYSWLFVVSMVVSIISVLMLHFWVKEPRFEV